MTDTPRVGRVIVISGPSGCGKSTIVEALLSQSDLPLVRSVSATTRPKRPSDVAGKTYRFLSKEAFREAAARGEFLESARVHGNWYGTPRREVRERLRQGRWVILEIDVQGGMAIRKMFPGSTLIFLTAPSHDEYERRLRGRAEDGEDVIRRRLAGIPAELAQADRYDYRVVNDSVERATQEIRRILLASRGQGKCSTN